MFWLFAIYILVYLAFSFGELGTALHYPNITCIKSTQNIIDYNTTNDTNITNMTNVLNDHDNDNFFGVIDSDILEPNIWLFANAGVGSVIVVCMIFIFILILKKNGTDKGCISRSFLWIVLLMILSRICLFVYAVIIWSIPKKNCNIVIFNLSFNNLLYIIYGITFLGIIYEGMLLGVPPNKNNAENDNININDELFLSIPQIKTTNNAENDMDDML